MSNGGGQGGGQGGGGGWPSGPVTGLLSQDEGEQKVETGLAPFSHSHDSIHEHLNRVRGNEYATSMAPGQMAVDYLSEGEVYYRAPLVESWWFLWEYNSILPDNIKPDHFDKLDAHTETNKDQHRAVESLKPIIERYPGIRPSYIIQVPSQPHDGVLNLKQARFETWSYRFAMLHPSPGPDWVRYGHQENEEDPDQTTEPVSEYYGGYIAFPVGQPGIQEAMSIVSETMDEESKQCVWREPGEEQEAADLRDPKVVETTNRLLAPRTTTWEPGEILGRKVLEYGYLTSNDVVDGKENDKSHYEIIAHDFQGYSEPNKPPLWSRFYFPMEGKFPMPGELVALVCKTMPFVVWFYQKSQPHLFAANWVETEFYTSGIVQEKILPGEEDHTFAPTYKVLCKGQYVYIKPSDFKEYVPGERVAILKAPYSPLTNTFVWEASYSAWNGNFTWESLYFDEHKKDPETSDISAHEAAIYGWWILPLTFYKEQE